MCKTSLKWIFICFLFYFSCCTVIENETFNMHVFFGFYQQLIPILCNFSVYSFSGPVTPCQLTLWLITLHSWIGSYIINRTGEFTHTNWSLVLKKWVMASSSEKYIFLFSWVELFVYMLLQCQVQSHRCSILINNETLTLRWQKDMNSLYLIILNIWYSKFYQFIKRYSNI